MQEAQTVVDMSPWVGVIGAIIGWGGFLIFVGVFKNAIITGFSMYIAELIWKANGEEGQNKLARKLANSEKVIEALRELKSQE